MFTFPVDPAALFEERSQQFAGWGIPRKIIRRVEAKIIDNWREAPGGWVYEWSKEAELAAQQKRLMLAAMLYGAARFPSVVTPMREQALIHQVDFFERAARQLPIYFERRCVSLPGPRRIDVPVHIYAPEAGNQRPLVLLTGGVDTGKMELHRLAYVLARLGRFRVAAIDMPGTSESGVLLSADAEQIYLDLLNTLAPSGRKAVFGVSFGAHWAAKLALLGAVDAAVNLGGPSLVFESGSKFMQSLPNGMPGIIANAMGLAGMPDDKTLETLMPAFSLRGLMAQKSDRIAPMLVINGERDQYIPVEDSSCFAQFPNHQVWLMRGMTHCAPEGLPRILPAVIAWLRLQLYGESRMRRLSYSIAQQLLPTKISLAQEK